MVLFLVMLSNHSASMLCAGAKLRHLSRFLAQRLVYPHMPGFYLSNSADRTVSVDEVYRRLKSLRCPDPFDLLDDAPRKFEVADLNETNLSHAY